MGQEQEGQKIRGQRSEVISQWPVLGLWFTSLIYYRWAWDLVHVPP